MSHTIADAIASVAAAPRGHAFHTTSASSRAQLGCNVPHDHGKAVRYERLPAGAAVALAMPDRPDVVAERVPSDFLLRTRALDAPRRPVVHCPSFLNTGRCVRGADCEYAHLVPPTGACTRYDAAALIASTKAQHGASARPSASPASSIATTTPMPWYARAAAVSSSPGSLPASLSSTPAQRAAPSHSMPHQQYQQHHQRTPSSPFQGGGCFYDLGSSGCCVGGGARHATTVAGCIPSALAAIGGESARAAAASAAAEALLSNGATRRRGSVVPVVRRRNPTRRGGGTSDSRRCRADAALSTSAAFSAIATADQSSAAATTAEPSSLTSSTTDSSSGGASASRRLSASWRHNPYGDLQGAAASFSSAPPSPSEAFSGIPAADE